jgi:hypothetical protein
MVLWNPLDGGPSQSGPLLGPYESMRGGTPGTNPHHTLCPIIRLVTNGGFPPMMTVDIFCIHKIQGDQDHMFLF